MCDTAPRMTRSRAKAEGAALSPYPNLTGKMTSVTTGKKLSKTTSREDGTFDTSALKFTNFSQNDAADMQTHLQKDQDFEVSIERIEHTGLPLEDPVSQDVMPATPNKLHSINSGGGEDAMMLSPPLPETRLTIGLLEAPTLERNPESDDGCNVDDMMMTSPCLNITATPVQQADHSTISLLSPAIAEHASVVDEEADALSPQQPLQEFSFDLCAGDGADAVSEVASPGDLLTAFAMIPIENTVPVALPEACTATVNVMSPQPMPVSTPASIPSASLTTNTQSPALSAPGMRSTTTPLKSPAPNTVNKVNGAALLTCKQGRSPAVRVSTEATPVKSTPKPVVPLSTPGDKVASKATPKPAVPISTPGDKVASKVTPRPAVHLSTPAERLSSTGTPSSTASLTPAVANKPALSKAGVIEPKIKEKRVSISSSLPLTSGGNFAKPKAFTPHPKSGSKGAPSFMSAESIQAQEHKEEQALTKLPLVTTEDAVPSWDTAMQLAAALPSHRTTVEEVPESAAAIGPDEGVSMDMEVDTVAEQTQVSATKVVAALKAEASSPAMMMKLTMPVSTATLKAEAASSPAMMMKLTMPVSTAALKAEAASSPAMMMKLTMPVSTAAYMAATKSSAQKLTSLASPVITPVIKPRMKSQVVGNRMMDDRSMKQLKREVKAAVTAKANVRGLHSDDEEEAVYNKEDEDMLVLAMKSKATIGKGKQTALIGMPAPLGSHVRFDEGGQVRYSPSSGKAYLKGVPVAKGQHIRFEE
ncbi:hypothetical protein CEUSTIGMA_g2843.t1 [Chlamydomonas eustigma]|uniref:Uncharacterized protein n=1 Tax=Chlamydomonas eustigma TaxID=1157962 RepID=A0A250WXH4_9CHLO|nr:hypothetical protein CEUSTIGMA_g2843.t1 [Chlamydomonas eustigma]|eukprot:GAX75399.1 hypothetical protein CEUSTIGMA_g2843.t1 [Chlamydomonas eustigma]